MWTERQVACSGAAPARVPAVLHRANAQLEAHAMKIEKRSAQIVIEHDGMHVSFELSPSIESTADLGNSSPDQQRPVTACAARSSVVVGVIHIAEWSTRTANIASPRTPSSVSIRSPLYTRGWFVFDTRQLPRIARPLPHYPNEASSAVGP